MFGVDCQTIHVMQILCGIWLWLVVCEMWLNKYKRYEKQSHKQIEYEWKKPHKSATISNKCKQKIWILEMLLIRPAW